MKKITDKQLEKIGKYIISNIQSEEKVKGKKVSKKLINELNERLDSLEVRISRLQRNISMTDNPLVKLLVDDQGNRSYEKLGNICKFTENNIEIGKSIYKLIK